MTVYLESYNKYLKWCEENNYDPDTEYDREEQNHKRDKVIYVFIKKNDSDSYASLSYTQNYDYGSENFEIEEGFSRKEEQVVVTKVSYVKE